MIELAEKQEQAVDELPWPVRACQREAPAATGQGLVGPDLDGRRHVRTARGAPPCPVPPGPGFFLCKEIRPPPSPNSGHRRIWSFYGLHPILRYDVPF